MQAQAMPVLFIGHGSPMNAIEDNAFTQTWRATAAALPRPRAILCVSAHWYTTGSLLLDQECPRTIYDMYGFPDELYRVTYPAPGAPDVARAAQALLGEGRMESGWGFDHGVWSVLRQMFPLADIPVTMLSVDRTAAPDTHYRLGQALQPLREQGVLILGSGNVVHNLARVRWDMETDGLPWAHTFDDYIKASITAGRHDDVVHYERAGESARLAVPISDHYAPLLVAMGAAGTADAVTVSNDVCVLGSLSMTCYRFDRHA